MNQPASTKFARLELRDWKQFRSIELDLSSRLTVLTGANAIGKTSILGLLGRHFSWMHQFLALPERDADGKRIFKAGLRRDLTKLAEEELEDVDVEEPSPFGGNYVLRGNLSYSDGSNAKIWMPEDLGGIQYDLQFDLQPFVPGLYLPSHRQMSGYQRIEWMPTSFTPSNQILETYLNEIRSRYQGQGSSKSNMTIMKEALLSAANFGNETSLWSADPDAKSVWEGFQRVVGLLAPESLGFLGLGIEPPDLIVRTNQGNFPIDAVSGGLSAILEVAFQIFLRSREYTDFTVLLDEPENHLHPSLQRSLMPRLLAAFPGVNFVIATHSPFIVTSEPESRVYVLQRADDGVVSSELDFVNKAASAEETLRDVLDVPTSVPVWAVEAYNSVLRSMLERESVELDAALITEVRDRLAALGLREYMPVLLSRLADEADQRGGL